MVVDIQNGNDEERAVCNARNDKICKKCGSRTRRRKGTQIFPEIEGLCYLCADLVPVAVKCSFCGRERQILFRGIYSARKQRCMECASDKKRKHPSKAKKITKFKRQGAPIKQKMKILCLKCGKKFKSGIRKRLCI